MKNKAIILMGICLVITLQTGMAQLWMQKVDGGYLVMEGEQNVAFYQYNLTGPTPDLMRNNFLHPVYLPDETVITENAPDDHMHHRGIFWAWHQILIGSEQVSDSWDLRNFITDIKRVRFKTLKNGNGRLKTKTFWLSPQYKDAGKAYMKEEVTSIFHPKTQNYRIIDVIITLTPLVDSLQLGGSDDVKGYGGFSTRIKLPDDVRFFSSNGKVEPANEAVEAGDYMNISGTYAKDGTAPGGLLIYADPDNQPGSPTWILRSKKSMQNAVFPGRKPVYLPKHRPLELKYSVVVYTGKIDVNQVLNEIRSTFRKIK
ncbi:DUF6807 family protein [Saccharicrinis sp. FJH54]|uniref:DUF6807 family protein n=1 Tax=Saccharicrinis sp. FJH54 TaxID=3344665 RepID=UPI0035D3E350